MNNSIKPIFNLFNHLSFERKKQLIFTFVVMIISGITELIVINSVIPLFAAITNPENLSQFKVSRVIAKILSIQINEEILYPFIIFLSLCNFFHFL